MKYGSKSRKKKNKSGSANCEICLKPFFLLSHHIEGRDVKNANAAANILDICPNCHEEIHRGDIIVEGKFMTSNGLQIFWHKKEEESITGKEAKVYIK